MSKALALKSSTIRYVAASDLRIWRPAGATHLRIEILEDRCILSGVFKRAFPLSETNRFLSVQESDGSEVAILKDTDGLDAASKNFLEGELDRRYYTPHISRIDALVAEAGMWKFGVVTQRGVKEFFVRNWRDSAHETSPGRWHIVSVDGARYEIPNLSKLDERSLRLLDQLL